MCKSFLLILLIALSTSTVKAQEDVSKDLSTADLRAAGELDEAPPRPEPPYPGSEDIDAVTQAPAATPTTTSPTLASPALTPGSTWGAKLPAAAAPQAPLPGVARPIKIDEEGHYYYGIEPSPSRANPNPIVAKPSEKNKEGEYVYDPEDKSTTPKGSDRGVVERPVEITEKGDYYYKLDDPKSKRTSSFRIGVMSPPKIVNSTTTFASIYGSNYQPVLFGDYEWRITSKVGRLGVKFTSGLFLASGRGVFISPRPEGTLALERFTFFMFPNQATAIYRFQFTDKQIFVPYVEGGGAYYTMAEVRDDSKPPKFAGAAGLVAAGGINVLLDWADRRGVQRLRAEYGINHVWLSLEGRTTIGAVSAVDITSQAYSAGVLFDF